MIKEPLRRERFSSNSDYLLKLIEEEDATLILSGENAEDFNKLMKYELITIEDHKLHLTRRGEKAKEIGVSAMLQELETIDKLEAKPVIADFHDAEEKENRTLLIYIFLAFFLIAILFLAIYL